MSVCGVCMVIVSVCVHDGSDVVLAGFGIVCVCVCGVCVHDGSDAVLPRGRSRAHRDGSGTMTQEHQTQSDR